MHIADPQMQNAGQGSVSALSGGPAAPDRGVDPGDPGIIGIEVPAEHREYLRQDLDIPHAGEAIILPAFHRPGSPSHQDESVGFAEVSEEVRLSLDPLFPIHES